MPYTIIKKKNIKIYIYFKKKKKKKKPTAGAARPPSFRGGHEPP